MLMTGARYTRPCLPRGPAAPALYRARASSEIASVTSWTRSGSQVAAMAMGTGKSVVGRFDQTPCRHWFHPPHAGTWRRSMPGELWYRARAFSSSVIRPIRSSTRLSVGWAGSRYGGGSAAVAAPPSRNGTTRRQYLAGIAERMGHPSFLEIDGKPRAAVRPE